MNFNELSLMDTDTVYTTVNRMTEIRVLTGLLEEGDECLNYYAVVCLRVRLRHLREARRRRRRRLGTSA